MSKAYSQIPLLLDGLGLYMSHNRQVTDGHTDEHIEHPMDSNEMKSDKGR